MKVLKAKAFSKSMILVSKDTFSGMRAELNIDNQLLSKYQEFRENSNKIIANLNEMNMKRGDLIDKQRDLIERQRKAIEAFEEEVKTYQEIIASYENLRP